MNAMDLAKAPAARRVLVTGADGFLGRGLVAALARQPGLDRVVATDVREVPPERHGRGCVYLVARCARRWR